MEVDYRNITIPNIAVSSFYNEASLRLSACIKTAAVEQSLLAPLAVESLLGVQDRDDKCDRLHKLAADVVEKATAGKFYRDGCGGLGVEGWRWGEGWEVLL